MGDGTGAVSAVGLESFVGGADAVGDALGAASAVDSESFAPGLCSFCVVPTACSEAVVAGGDEATGEALGVVSVVGPATAGGMSRPCLGIGMAPYFVGRYTAVHGVLLHTCTRPDQDAVPSFGTHPVMPARRCVGIEGDHNHLAVKRTPYQSINVNSSV